MPLDVEYIRKRLKDIKRFDSLRGAVGIPSKYRVPGSELDLNPPLPIAEVEAFEKRYGIELPEDYRRIITEIGNGGRGPRYELFPLGEYRSLDQAVFADHLAEPFPHQDAWNLPSEFWEREPDYDGMTPEAEERAEEEWDALLIEHYGAPWIMAGAMPISDLGCGSFEWLVVTGPQRGYVWEDRRADNLGVAPARDSDGNRVTFADWYMAQFEDPLPPPAATLSHQPGFLRRLPVLAAMIIGTMLAYGARLWWELPCIAFVLMLLALMPLLAGLERVLRPSGKSFE